MSLPACRCRAYHQFALTDLATLIVPAVGIAIVAFSDNVLTARAFATRRSEEIDANAELRALGIGNIAAGLTHGFPVSLQRQPHRLR